MKANEVPEKIYMTPSFGEPDNVLLASFSKSHLNFHRDIEYTRTDAFIEKAVQFIKDYFQFEDPSWYKDGEPTVKDKAIDDFRKYMKGE